MFVGGNQEFASPEEVLEHFGVKGMRWGVRKEDKPAPVVLGPVKEPIVRKTKNGDTFTLTPNPPNVLDKNLAKVSKGYRERLSNSSHLKITDKDGKKIGDASFWFQGKDDIYLNWIQVKKSARGNGYASAILKSAAEHGKKTGRKRMVLEVPGNAPDARHIYEKMGFKPTGVVQGHKNDVWGGLTQYEYRFDKEG
jgi:predicted GNAT family acetyltransferase